jgi:nitroreductase
MDESLFKVIRERFSARGPYDPQRAVPPSLLEHILEAARWAPTAHNMQNYEIIVVDDKNVLTRLGNVVTSVSPAFIRENYQQLAFSEAELIARRTGILSTMLPAAWTSPAAANGRLASTAVKRPLRDLFARCPTLLVVVYDPQRRAPGSEGDALGMMSLGCVIENMWLAAASLGLGFHVLSAGGARRRARNQAHLADSGTPTRGARLSAGLSCAADRPLSARASLHARLRAP